MKSFSKLLILAVLAVFIFVSCDDKAEVQDVRVVKDKITIPVTVHKTTAGALIIFDGIDNVVDGYGIVPKDNSKKTPYWNAFFPANNTIKYNTTTGASEGANDNINNYQTLVPSSSFTADTSYVFGVVPMGSIEYLDEYTYFNITWSSPITY